MEIDKNIFDVYNVFRGSLNQIPFTQKTIINTINQYSFCVAEQDVQFKNALKNSDILLPDGVGIVFAIRSTLSKSITKISGADLHSFLLSKLNEESGACFYLGSSENTLEKIKSKLQKEYSHLRSYSFSPPFKPEFSDADNANMIRRINECNPDVLFVGMTAPKQEKWINEHKDQINVNIICSIGAVFDFYAGTIKRPNEVWINLGLEWLVRLCKEPKRMWKRYIYYGPIFILKVLKEIIRHDFKIIVGK